MTGSGGTNTACAACKYQRRKCMPDCPLSPYFPADQPKRFANVHKLFGVSNTLRILKHVDPSKREDTVKSISYEADMRDKDPVHGCLGVIAMLQNQVLNLKDELSIAREQLYMLQQQSFESQQSPLQHALATTFATVTSGVHAGPVHGSNAALMHQLHPYCSFGGSNHQLSASNFNDHYLRHEGFDPPKLQMAEYDHRYGQADSSSLQQALALQIKANQTEQLQRAAPGSYFSAAVSSDQFDDSPVSHHQVHRQAALVEEEQAGMHMRRALPKGLANLAVTSDHNDVRSSANYSSATIHVPDHELRSPGVYLTLTSQH